VAGSDVSAASAAGAVVSSLKRISRHTWAKIRLARLGIPAVMAGVAILALLVYGFWRWRRNRPVRILCHTRIALRRLEDLGTLMQPESAREFPLRCSDIVRGYIEQRSQSRHPTNYRGVSAHLLETAECIPPRHQPAARRVSASVRFRQIRGDVPHVQNMESLRQRRSRFHISYGGDRRSVPGSGGS